MHGTAEVLDTEYRGWVHLGPSSAFPKKEVRTVRRFGEEIVVWRSASGTLTAAGSVCPHLGAHLGGGEVRGECIRCPFHHWQFDPRGYVFYVPGAKRLPTRARLDIHSIREVGGVVFMYHASSHDDSTDPIPWSSKFDAAITPQEGRMRTFETSTLPASLSSIAENVPDRAHFTIVHKSAFKGMEAMTWEQTGGSFKVSAHTKMGPTKAPCISEIEYFDAFNMQATTINEHTGSMYILLMLAPLGDGNVELLVAADSRGTVRGIDRVLNVGFRKLAVKGITEDAPIWKRKRTLSHPIVSEADGPILRFREWHAQFRQALDPVISSVAQHGD